MVLISVCCCSAAKFMCLIIVCRWKFFKASSPFDESKFSGFASYSASICCWSKGMWSSIHAIQYNFEFRHVLHNEVCKLALKLGFVIQLSLGRIISGSLKLSNDVQPRRLVKMYVNWLGHSDN